MSQTDMSTTPGAGHPRPKLKPGEKFLLCPAVIERTGRGKSTIYDMQKAGTFPHSIPLPGGRVAWLESEVLEWMESRVALRNTNHK